MREAARLFADIFTDFMLFNWNGLSGADWQALSSIASTLGLIAAVFGGVVALRSYRSATRAAENAQMHSLFRDYLHKRFEHDLQLSLRPDVIPSAGVGTPAGPLESMKSQLAALKLYALEDMWSWVLKQERRWLFRLGLTWRQSERRDFLISWRGTILVHANQEREAVAESILRYTPCYSLSFLAFVADRWEGNQIAFKALVKAQKRQAERGRRSSYRLSDAEMAEAIRHLATKPAGWAASLTNGH